MADLQNAQDDAQGDQGDEDEGEYQRPGGHDGGQNV